MVYLAASPVVPRDKFHELAVLILAEPSKEVSFIVLAVANFVAASAVVALVDVSAFPVRLPINFPPAVTEPVETMSPVTVPPVRGRYGWVCASN